LKGGLWLYLPLIYGFVVHPILDRLVGAVADPTFAPGDEKIAEGLLILTLPVYFALLLFSLSRAHLFATPWEFYIGAYAIGLNGGVIGITAAHELVHRKDRWQRGIGVALLSMVSYSHFRVEHVFGHHRWVATHRDPATARLGENIFTFWVRSIVGSYVSAWKIELENSAKKRGLISNRMVHYHLLQIAWMAAVWAIFGTHGLVFFIIQSAAAIWLLETINFVEHYGLVRNELPGGRHEPVAPKHSWDTNFALTNLSLFNLGMHARHHESASVPFEKLRAEPGAPALPAGYSAMLLLALVPPLWRSVMDPRVDKARVA
jgi:alkane 1-monooxygenase